MEIIEHTDFWTRLAFFNEWFDLTGDFLPGQILGRVLCDAGDAS